MNTAKTIASDLGFNPDSVNSVLNLFKGGATIPFIARYRKESTGSLDEVAIAKIRDHSLKIEEFDKRRESIIKSLEERDLYNDTLKQNIDNATSLKSLEDLYLPFRVKRRTKATVAREQGLGPLANQIFHKGENGESLAANYINADVGINSFEEALAGARYIIAEEINENLQARTTLRRLFESKANLSSSVIKKKQNKAQKYRDYFDWNEKASSAPSHRLLAIFRGESEGLLKVIIRPTEDEAIKELKYKFLRPEISSRDQISLAIADSYKRLLAPSMETELRAFLKETADTEAIRVFCDNLKELLMASPLGQKAILGIDPGFRTGCKVVCLNPQGKLLTDTVIYPTTSGHGLEKAHKVIKELVDKYKIEAIAIGNGTASRETETFVRNCKLPTSPIIVQVNESGASIYSASEIAREEFPNHDVTVRGAVSIARRLADPLAELVKIDAKSIGVGQYQHDVDQTSLKNGLDDIVMSCVNSIGVELNTASAPLLSYVSGLGPQLAKNIVDYRDENGAFTSKTQLKKIKRLGPKAFEQAAGFLRIRNAKNPLDTSAVHPERYDLLEKICKDNNTTVAGLMKDAEKRYNIDLNKYVCEDVGLPTLTDIMKELAKPGRDPRDQFEPFSFAENVEKMSDLEVGTQLPGIVTNVTNFGAFIDIGVHQDGLAHISQLADSFVKDPSTIVKVGQKVRAWVTEVDEDRKRIALSLRSDCPNTQEKAPRRQTTKNGTTNKTIKGDRKGQH